MGHRFVHDPARMATESVRGVRYRGDVNAIAQVA